MTEPIHAEAVVVEDDALVILHAQPGDDIEANFDQLQEHIAKLTADYEGAIVTPEYLKQAKKDRAYLNNLTKSLNQRRLDVERRYMAPIVAFKEKVNALAAPIKAASDAIDAQIKAIEEKEREDKHAELRKHYEDYAGALVDVVPFERIDDPKWLLKSTNLMAAFKEIETIVERIVTDEQTLTELDLAHPEDAKAEYFETLDLSKAIARSKQIEERNERARQLEEQKQAFARQRAEAEAAAVEEAFTAPAAAAEPPAPAAEASAPAETVPPADVARDRTFTVTCNEAQLERIIAFIQALGLTGRVSR